MCGIVGCVGKEIPVLDILIEGLERLEYRGYDSAGVATLQNGQLVVDKQEGKIVQLKKHLGNQSFSGNIGLGHTRWATHGRPSENNAHPHTDCQQQIAVVHNGIIENYQSLRDDLTQKGHQFASETDTEVIAHLIEEESQKGTLPLEESVRRCLKKAKGAYAIGVISTRDPNKLVAARLGSPLVLGLGNGIHFIASDVSALLKHTKEVIYPNDGDVLVLTPGKFQITDLDQKEVRHDIHSVEWTYDQVAKNGYKKFMLKEIHEQPTIMESILKRRVSKKNEINFEELQISQKILEKVERIFIVSCGTAFHAGFYLKYFMERHTSIPVEIDIGSEFRYRKPKLAKNVLVIIITQSGETADTLASLRLAKEMGCHILSICNVMGSTIDRESHGVIYTHAGPEIGVASTKAYTAQMLCGILFTLYLGKLKKEISSKTVDRILTELRTVLQKMNSIFKEEKKISQIALKNFQADSALYLGRSFNYPSALEGALKNKEISYMHAEGHAAGEMKHGPIALIDENLPVFCICPKGDAYEKMFSNIKEVEARNGNIISIVSEGEDRIGSISSSMVFIPEISEDLSPLLVAIPLQLLAYYIAEAKGCDIDQPRNLAKSVTVE